MSRFRRVWLESYRQANDRGERDGADGLLGHFEPLRCWGEKADPLVKPSAMVP
jgi:hypothetical protein